VEEREGVLKLRRMLQDGVALDLEMRNVRRAAEDAELVGR